MEPAEQALLAGECPCCHFIEGVAGGFIPPLLRDAPLDGQVKIRSAEAMAMTRRLHREFGLLGRHQSSGANVVAALRIAGELGPRATVVTLLCDRAERYFSTPPVRRWRSRLSALGVSLTVTIPKFKGPKPKTTPHRAVLDFCPFPPFEFVSGFGFRVSDLGRKQPATGGAGTMRPALCNHFGLDAGAACGSVYLTAREALRLGPRAHDGLAARWLSAAGKRKIMRI